MTKRNKLEIIKDILTIISSNHNSIKPTPLLRQSNISSIRFKGYYSELLKKDFIKETHHSNTKYLSLTEKGLKFLEKYKTILSFIEEFEL
jgi:predicted transcriptional regulator